MRRAPFLACLSSLVIDLFSCDLLVLTLGPKTPKDKYKKGIGGAPGNCPALLASDTDAAHWEIHREELLIYALEQEATRDVCRAEWMSSASVSASFQLRKEMKIDLWDGPTNKKGAEERNTSPGATSLYQFNNSTLHVS